MQAKHLCCLFFFFFHLHKLKRCSFHPIAILIKLYKLSINYLQDFHSLLNLLELPWSFTRIYCTTVTPIATNSYLPTGWRITSLGMCLFVSFSLVDLKSWTSWLAIQIARGNASLGILCGTVKDRASHRKLKTSILAVLMISHCG